MRGYESCHLNSAAFFQSSTGGSMKEMQEIFRQKLVVAVNFSFATNYFWKFFLLDIS